MAQTVAYLGPAGTFTEEAVLRFTAAGAFGPGPAPQTLPLDSPAAVLDAVRAGRADAGVVAVENSVDGPVTQAFDALAAGGVAIRAELDLTVAFTVMARPGTVLGQVRSIASHPVGHRQIAGWLGRNAPRARFVPASSNAAAARMVAAGQADAAAAPDRAAELFGLERLAEDVADVAGARTRFVVVGPPAAPPARTGNDRTCVAFLLPDVPGSLNGALGEFAQRGVNLTRIASRPTRARLGRYRFYADLTGHIEDTPVAEALRALWLRAEAITFLGSWPAAGGADDSGDGAQAGPDLERIAQATAWVDAARTGRDNGA